MWVIAAQATYNTGIRVIETPRVATPGITPMRYL